MKKYLVVGFTLWLLARSSGAAAPAEHPSATPQDVFDSMRATFHAEKAGGVRARYQFEISGARGGVWSIEVRDAHAHFQRAKIQNPDVTLIVSDKDWVALSNDKLSGPWAYLTGRLKVRGNHLLARKLDELF